VISHESGKDGKCHDDIIPFSFSISYLFEVAPSVSVLLLPSTT
jgi:hypothetical protein